MKKITIIYWTGTGNTEEMAKAVEQGAQAATAGGNDATVELLTVSEATPDVVSSDVLILGCPAMATESLEEGEMEPFFASIEGKLSGKKIGLFGSYDWGDGEWIRTWRERVESAGATMIADEVIANLAPDDEALAACRALGEKAVATA